MSFQAYLDNVKAKTGKTPQDFAALAKEKGLDKHGEIVAWLKSDFGLGHGHANAVTAVILSAGAPKVSKSEQIDRHFSGAKAVWRAPYDALLAKLMAFGSDVKVAPTNSYLSLLRGNDKFGVIQVTGKRLDVGIKLKGTAPAGRFTEAGAWNSMVTHRVQVDDPSQLDDELIDWLRQAYDNA